MCPTIEYFMWGYQSYFRFSLDFRAQDIFNRLDPSLAPEVFLVGFLEDPSHSGSHPTCVESEDNFWVHSEDFSIAPDIAQSLLPTYPESALSHSSPLVQEQEDALLRDRSIRDSVLQVLLDHSASPTERYFYVSLPASIEGYRVCAVLSLSKEGVDLFPHLTTNQYKIHDYRYNPIPVSLIDAVTTEFLRYTTKELDKPNPMEPSSIDPEEFSRRAGVSFAQGIVLRLGDALEVQGHDLFRNVSTLARLIHEGRTSEGRLLLAKRGHKAVKQELAFENPIPLGLLRTSRKILQLSSSEMLLQTNSREVTGLATVRNVNLDDEDLFEIRIVGSDRWAILHGERSLMTVDHGVPSLTRPEFSEPDARNVLSSAFANIDEQDIDNLMSLVEQASSEQHGTMLLISTIADAEATRLTRQSTPISPQPLTATLLRHVTPIDGAVLLDPKGTCHAIGVILDGMAVPELGDPGRGARYNSAVRYVQTSSQDAACVAVVVSEDGGVDFVTVTNSPSS